MSTSPRFRGPAITDAEKRAIGATFRARRLALASDTSPEKLSLAAGLSRSAVRLIEDGRTGINVATLFAIARVLACNPGDLLPKLFPKKSLPDVDTEY